MKSPTRRGAGGGGGRIERRVDPGPEAVSERPVRPHAGRGPLAAVVTDLDGTLLDARGQLPESCRAALHALGERGILRVVATGRSPFSLRRALPRDCPVDYVAFSSGAGVMRWPDESLLHSTHLPAGAGSRLASGLLELGMDFMLHAEIPDNHVFSYRRSRRENPDFERRLGRYREFGVEIAAWDLSARTLTQAVVIEPEPDPRRERLLRHEFAELSIVVATSPLDGTSRWLEIFASGVCKSTASRWIIEREQRAGRVMAVGNDHNDRDLLDWADLAFVVANAPEQLRRRHATVASNDDGGFAEAVERALESDP